MIENFDFQQLRMFYMLGRTGSYTETARRLLRTQSAVSHAIRKLEDSAGVKLIAAKGAHFRLTEDGKELLAACTLAFDSLDGAVESIAKRHGRGVGKLRLGATVEFGCSILLKHMGPFIKAHPEIEIEFYMSHELITPLLSDDVDLIIDCKEHNNPSLLRTPLFREKYAVVCSPEFKREFSIADIADLRRCPVLSMDDQAAWWHNFIFSLPSMSRPELKKIIPINHVRGMIVAAKNTIGVALVPRYSILNEIGEGSLVVLFPDIKLLEDRFSIYEQKGKASHARHRILRNYLKNIRPSEFGS